MGSITISELRLLRLAPHGTAQFCAQPSSPCGTTASADSLASDAKTAEGAGPITRDAVLAEAAPSTLNAGREAHPCGPCVFHSSFGGLKCCVKDSSQAGENNMQKCGDYIERTGDDI